MMIIDAQTLPPRERHATIFQSFDALALGDSLTLIVNHEPRPLYYQFDAERSDLFEWTYLEAGPDIWRVQITRKANGQ